MVLAVIGVALVAALVTFLVLLVVRPPKKSVVAETSTTVPASTTTVPPPTVPAAPPLTQARLDALTDELVPFVEQTRQLRFDDPPRPVLDDDATFTAAFHKRLARTDAMLEKLEVPFKALGLNPNGVDLVDAQTAFYGDGTVSFYDPVTDVLHVRAVGDTPYVSASLVAALTEQLDDQHFDVSEMDTPKGLGDDVIGLRSLVVGDGQRVASVWIHGRSMDDQASIDEEAQARFGAAQDPGAVPPALSAWLATPAKLGGGFTSRLVTRSSSKPLDHAFTTPPDGSAAVVLTDRYVDGVGQLPVPVPEADGPDTAHGTLGYVILSHAFAGVVEETKVFAAMDTYRGDAMVAWKAGGRSCVRVDLSTGDIPGTLLQEVVRTWAAQADGKVELVKGTAASGRQLIRLTVCTPGSSDSTTTTEPPTTTAPSQQGPTSTVPGHDVPEI